jgi:NAD(P)-dependent dehydrogenase (short-subunit alcohol dehydrogenase family)
MTLSNKVVLVTGADRGIGAAGVREMLKAGVTKIYATQPLQDNLLMLTRRSLCNEFSRWFGSHGRNPRNVDQSRDRHAG